MPTATQLYQKVQDCEDSNGVFNPNEDCTCTTYEEYLTLHGQYVEAYDAENAAPNQPNLPFSPRTKDDTIISYIGASGIFLQQNTPLITQIGNWLAPKDDKKAVTPPKKDPKTGKEIPDPNAVGKNDTGSNTMLYVGIGGAVLLIIIVVIFATKKSDNDKND
jgi:hypothetical protein